MLEKRSLLILRSQIDGRDGEVQADKDKKDDDMDESKTCASESDGGKRKR